MRINNAYFPTWEENLDWEKGVGQSLLANIADSVNCVALSFLRPDAKYYGLETKMDELFFDGNIPLTTLKREIAIYKERGRDRIVLASTGGELAGNFLEVNYAQLVDAIDDLGIDGIDLDYEPNGVMAKTQEEVDKYIELITSFREAFDNKTKITGKRYLISCAPTGIGLLGKFEDFTSMGVKDEKLLMFDGSRFNNLDKNASEIINNLKKIIPLDEQSEELNIGKIDDDSVLKQPKYLVGTVGSCFGFDSAGKMARVFLKINSSKKLPQYNYIGQMVDIVLYQAYNMGSGNILGKILCYESHRLLSDYFNRDIEGSGFVLGHGSHTGEEAWPHFSYTKRRLNYIYSYIKEYGRECDGASFWSYTSSFEDRSENVPSYGMEYESTVEIFDHVGPILGIGK